MAMRRRVSKACLVCRHPERIRIETLLAGGASCAAVGAQFGLSKHCVWRHWTNERHVSVQRKANLTCGSAEVEDLVAAATRENKSLLDYLGAVRSVLLRQFLSAAEVGDRNGVGVVAGRLLETLDRLGKLSGELRYASLITVNNNTLNLVASPQFVALQKGLIALARQHPGARGDIVALLRVIDGEDERVPPLIEGKVEVEAGTHAS